MTKGIEREIQEAFHEEANERGFCLDQEWSDCENPYLDGDTHLAFDLFRSGWMKAKTHEAKKLKGCMVVPVEPTEAMIEAGNDANECGSWPHEIYAAMLEAARGGNE